MIKLTCHYMFANIDTSKFDFQHLEFSAADEDKARSVYSFHSRFGFAVVYHTNVLL